MGRPPWTRTRACSTQSSSTRWAAPTISALRARAPRRKAGASSSQPLPGAPSRSSGPTSTWANSSSKSLSPVMLSSGRAVMPARSIGSTSAVGPAAARPSTITSVATCASGTKSLRPVRRPGAATGRASASGSSRPDSSSTASVQIRSPSARPGSSVPGAAAAGRGQRGGGDDRARDEGARAAGASQLLHQRQRVPDRASAAAQLRRDQQPRPSERRDLLPEVGREAPRVEGQLLHALGRAALLEEGPRRLLQDLLRRREREVH